MTLSPSEIFQSVQSGKCVYIEKHLSVRPLHYKKSVRVIYLINQGRPDFKSRSIAAANPLAMMQAIAVLRKELHQILVEEVRAIIEQEQAKATEQFLTKQRNNIARMHRDREAKEQQRAENALRYVSGPIKAILERVKPVVDPFAYRNVYGRPAEVFIF